MKGLTMARYNQFAGRSPKGQRPFKISFTGNTTKAVFATAQTWLDSNPNKQFRTLSKPRKLKNGQWSIFIT
jgi:hypothetical protein